MNTAAAAGSAGEMHSDSLPSIGPYFYYSFCYDPSNSCALGILVFLELASIIRPLYMYMFLLQLASSICYLFVLPPPSTPINLFMYTSLSSAFGSEAEHRLNAKRLRMRIFTSSD